MNRGEKRGEAGVIPAGTHKGDRPNRPHRVALSTRPTVPCVRSPTNSLRPVERPLWYPLTRPESRPHFGPDALPTREGSGPASFSGLSEALVWRCHEQRRPASRLAVVQRGGPFQGDRGGALEG